MATSTRTLTTAQLTERLNALESQYQQILLEIQDIGKSLASRVRLSDLSVSEEELKGLIKSNSVLINQLEAKLATVQLPEETKYYLEASEIENFRSNFSKLLAVMANMERLYNNLVAYTSTIQ